MQERSKRYRANVIRGTKGSKDDRTEKLPNGEQVLDCQNCGNPEIQSDGHCDECGFSNPINT